MKKICLLLIILMFAMTGCSQSKMVGIPDGYIDKEEYYDKDGFQDYTLEQYGNLVLKNNNLSASELQNLDGLTEFEYEFTNPNTKDTYTYFSFVYKADDAFWLVQFACDVKDYNEYKPYFIEWAKTVDVSVKYEGENSGIGAVNNQKY